MEAIIFIFLLALILIVVLILQKIIFDKLSEKIDSLNETAREEIRFALEPNLVKLSPEASDLVELAVESWRLEQKIDKAVTSLTENQKTGIENSIQKIKKYLDKNDIEVRDYTGQKYNEGLSLDILSIEKDPSNEIATVKKTIEPTILHKGHVVKKAKIILIKND